MNQLKLEVNSCSCIHVCPPQSAGKPVCATESQLVLVLRLTGLKHFVSFLMDIASWSIQEMYFARRMDLASDAWFSMQTSNS